MSVSEMKTYIQDFSFDDCDHGNQGYNRLLIQLFGYTGHGKSSFINSCMYVMDDVYRVCATVASSQDKPETMKRNAYKLTNSITLVDNRGCVRMDRKEKGQIYAQLGIFPAVVLTHETSEHLPDILQKFRRMGVQHIFPLENYTQEDNMKIRCKHEKILECLIEIIRDVDFRMTEIRDPIQEMKRRKRILHKSLIEREIARVTDDLGRAEAEYRRREAEFRRRESEFSERERFLEEKLRKEKERGDREWWDKRAFR